MNVEDFKAVKNEILKIYNDQKSFLNSDETNALKKEIYKLDSFIDIYQRDDIDYRVMRLERLYMQNVMDKTEEEFSNLSIEEKADIFTKLFPENWVYEVSMNDKYNYLEKAIIENKIIHIDNYSFDENNVLKK